MHGRSVRVCVQLVCSRFTRIEPKTGNVNYYAIEDLSLTAATPAVTCVRFAECRLCVCACVRAPLSKNTINAMAAHNILTTRDGDGSPHNSKIDARKMKHEHAHNTQMHIEFRSYGKHQNSAIDFCFVIV